MPYCVPFLEYGVFEFIFDFFTQGNFTVFGKQTLNDTKKTEIFSLIFREIRI